jgi:hypothetical protein
MEQINIKQNCDELTKDELTSARQFEDAVEQSQCTGTIQFGRLVAKVTGV